MHSSFSITLLPAVYIGIQRGYGRIPSMELYNLLAPLGDHPTGSTVGRSTLEKHGWRLLPTSRRIGHRPRGVKQVESVSQELLAESAA